MRGEGHSPNFLTLAAKKSRGRMREREGGKVFIDFGSQYNWIRNEEDDAGEEEGSDTTWAYQYFL